MDAILMKDAPVFQRLERAVIFIARHPYYPGKSEVVDDCLADLEAHCREGSLTVEEKTTLAAILSPDRFNGNGHSDGPRAHVGRI